MAKFHNGPNGPAPCTASKRPCPVGGEHFATQEEAETAYAKTMEGEHGALPTPSKKVPEVKAPEPTLLETKYTLEEQEDFASIISNPSYLDEQGYPSIYMDNPTFEREVEADPRFKEFVEDSLSLVPTEDGSKRTVDDIIAFTDRESLAGRISLDEECADRYRGGDDDYDEDDEDDDYYNVAEEDPDAGEKFLQDCFKEQPHAFIPLSFAGKDFVLVVNDW